MRGVGHLDGPPASWEELNGVAYCLACRRKLAGDAKVKTLEHGSSPGDRQRAHAEGRLEFELRRDPDRCDTRIARASSTNLVLTRQVRDRLGAYPTRPV